MEDHTGTTMQIDSATRKPPVIVRACDMCRKRKIRCEPTTDGCAQCTKSQLHCHFTPISTKKKHRQPAGFKHITELEERLRKMEGRLENVLKKRNAREKDFSHDDSTSSNAFDIDSGEVIKHGGNQGTDMIRQAKQGKGLVDYYFTTNVPTSSNFRDSDGVFGGITIAHESLFSPMQASLSCGATHSLGSFTLPSFQELPAKSIALELINETFRSFNSFFPLFNEQDFLQEFHRHYLDSSPRRPGWWACINVVLSLAHRFRAMRTLEPAYETAQSCKYVHNALAVVSQLNIMQNSLPAIQALVGMVVVIQGTPHSHVASVLIAAAVRLAQSMGLHRRTQDSSFTEAETEQRKRVFWVAYFLDKDISLRMGLPSAQDDDDMDAELPTGTISKLPLCGDNLRTINFFNSRIGLAVIQGQIYKRLHSVQATRQSAAQKAAIAQELNAILSYWRSGVPIDFEDYPVTPLQVPLPAEFLHMLILRFTYVNCLVMIDRHLPPAAQPQVDATPAMQGSFTPAESLCVTESRKAVRLIQIAPLGDYACIWILLHPFFAAVTALLDNVLRSPASWQAQSDLQVVEPFLRLLEILAAEESQCSRSEESKRMRRFCRELNGRATEAVRPLHMRLAIS